jgi:hypothetical protein
MISFVSLNMPKLKFCKFFWQFKYYLVIMQSIAQKACFGFFKISLGKKTLPQIRSAGCFF